MSDIAFDGSPLFGFVGSPLLARNDIQTGYFLRAIVLQTTGYGIAPARRASYLNEVYDAFVSHPLPSLTTGLNGDDITGQISVTDFLHLKEYPVPGDYNKVFDPPELEYVTRFQTFQPLSAAVTTEEQLPREFYFVRCGTEVSSIAFTPFGVIRLSRAILYLGPTKFPVCVSRSEGASISCETSGRVESPASGDGWSHDGSHITLTCPRPPSVSAFSGSVRVDVRPIDPAMPPCCDIGPPP